MGEDVAIRAEKLACEALWGNRKWEGETEGDVSDDGEDEQPLSQTLPGDWEAVHQAQDGQPRN